MSLGEKIKELRNKFSLSQEQLAEKLNVSRQAITKWEGNVGLPDTENLKSISELFGVTIDYLLDNNSDGNFQAVMREEVNFKNLWDGYDEIISLLKQRYPEPNEIYSLVKTRKLSIASLIIGPSKIEAADYLKETAIYFLVKNYRTKMLIKVTKTYIETRQLPESIDENKFIIDKEKFTKINKKI